MGEWLSCFEMGEVGNGEEGGHNNAQFASPAEILRSPEGLCDAQLSRNHNRGDIQPPSSIMPVDKLSDRSCEHMVQILRHAGMDEVGSSVRFSEQATGGGYIETLSYGNWVQR